MPESMNTLTIQKKEKKLPFDFLLAEFPKGNLTIRTRFRVIQHRKGYGINIIENVSKAQCGRARARKSRIEISPSVSEQQLYKALTKHLSANYKVSRGSITLRWENNTLKMPIDRTL